MGERITFRERTEGVARGSNVTGTITEPRVLFLKGRPNSEIADDPNNRDSPVVGNYTQFPMKVTLAQLDEIFYRVRDSTFETGDFSFDWSWYPTETHRRSGDATMSLKGTQPVLTAEASNPVEYMNLFDNGPYTAHRAAFRSHLAIRRDLITYPPYAETNYPTDLGGSFGPLFNTRPDGGGWDLREPMSERALWTPSSVLEFPEREFPYRSFNYTNLSGGRYLPSGLNHSIQTYLPVGSESNLFPGAYGPVMQGNFEMTLSGEVVDTRSYYDYFGGGDISCGFSNPVAYLDITGSGDPYDPDNELYPRFDLTLGLRFIASDNANIGLRQLAALRSGYLRVNTLYSTPIEPEGVTCRVILSGGAELSCPLRVQHMIGPPTPDETTVSWPLVPSPVITATKWWPYAHPDGSPAWNEDTGAYIPEGPPP